PPSRRIAITNAGCVIWPVTSGQDPRSLPKPRLIASRAAKVDQVSTAPKIQPRDHSANRKPGQRPRQQTQPKLRRSPHERAQTTREPVSVGPTTNVFAKPSRP